MDPLEQEDWSLMRRVAAGDEDAVAVLYDRFGALIYKAARQVLSSRAEAEDAVQDIFVRLWRTADRFDPRRARLVTWVMLIARRHLIDRLRRRGSRPEQLGLESRPEGMHLAASAGGTPTPAEGSAKLRDRLRELPQLQREVIERAYLQGFTLREVSVQLNTPLGTVKSALSRGLQRLRDRMGSEKAL